MIKLFGIILHTSEMVDAIGQFGLGCHLTLDLQTAAFTWSLCNYLKFYITSHPPTKTKHIQNQVYCYFLAQRGQLLPNSIQKSVHNFLSNPAGRQKNKGTN